MPNYWVSKRSGRTGKKYGRRKYSAPPNPVTRVMQPVRNVGAGKAAINQAYHRGLIHSFSRWTNTLSEVYQSGWNATPTADGVDGTSMKFQTPAVAGVSYAGIGFRFDDLQSNTEFNSLFDYFRINGVKLCFNFLYDNATLGGTLEAPQLYIVNDYDDATVPASVGELIQYANCREIQLFNKGRGRYTFFIRPRIMNTTTHTQQPWHRRPWVDMAGLSTVRYQGVKIALVNRNNASIDMYVKAKYYFQCKGQR